MDSFDSRGRKWRWLNLDRSTLVKLGLLASLGVVLLVASQLVRSPASAPGETDTAPRPAPTGGAVPVTSTGYRQDLEQQLTATLGQIKGAGNVVVQVSLENGRTVSYATNSQEEIRNTEERAEAGVTRSSQETRSEAQVVMAREGGSEKPVISGETLPAVRGVLVVASGANDPGVKEKLSQAVQVLLDLPAHKVMVLEKEEGK